MCLSGEHVENHARSPQSANQMLLFLESTTQRGPRSWQDSGGNLFPKECHRNQLRRERTVRTHF